MKMTMNQFKNKYSAYAKIGEYIDALTDGDVVELDHTQIEDGDDWYSIAGFVLEIAEPIEDNNGDYTAVDVYYIAVDENKDPYDDEHYRDFDDAESAVQSAYIALAEEQQELINDFWRYY